MFLVWPSRSVCQTWIALLIFSMALPSSSLFLTALVILPVMFLLLFLLFYYCCPSGQCFIHSTPSINHPQIYLFMLFGSFPFFPTFLLPPWILLGCLDALQRAIYAVLWPNPGGLIPPDQSHLPPKLRAVWSKVLRVLCRCSTCRGCSLCFGECCLHSAGWLLPFPTARAHALTCVMDICWINLQGRAGWSQMNAFAPEGACRLPEGAFLSGKARALQNCSHTQLLGSHKQKDKSPVNSNPSDGHPPFLNTQMMLQKC